LRPGRKLDQHSVIPQLNASWPYGRDSTQKSPLREQVRRWRRQVTHHQPFYTRVISNFTRFDRRCVIALDTGQCALNQGSVLLISKLLDDSYDVFSFRFVDEQIGTVGSQSDWPTSQCRR
jgi:hypothetical protein